MIGYIIKYPRLAMSICAKGPVHRTIAHALSASGMGLSYRRMPENGEGVSQKNGQNWRKRWLGELHGRIRMEGGDQPVSAT